MPPFDRSCTTSDQSAIVSIALTCITFDLSDIKNVVTLKSRVGVVHDN